MKTPKQDIEEKLQVERDRQPQRVPLKSKQLLSKRSESSKSERNGLHRRAKSVARTRTSVACFTKSAIARHVLTSLAIASGASGKASARDATGRAKSRLLPGTPKGARNAGGRASKGKNPLKSGNLKVGNGKCRGCNGPGSHGAGKCRGFSGSGNVPAPVK
jgi:hypothetical protein